MSHFDLFDSYHLRRPRTLCPGLFIITVHNIVKFGILGRVYGVVEQIAVHPAEAVHHFSVSLSSCSLSSFVISLSSI